MIILNKEFIPYEEALVLKELGFDEPCFGLFYQEQLELFKECEWSARTNSKYCEDFKDMFIDCTAPLYQQAFRWFREKYNLVGLPCVGAHEYTYKIWNEKKGRSGEMVSQFNLNGTYEESELACLRKLIELVKQQQR